VGGCFFFFWGKCGPYVWCVMFVGPVGFFCFLDLSCWVLLLCFFGPGVCGVAVGRGLFFVVFLCSRVFVFVF